jgi:hypothetical protein
LSPNQFKFIDKFIRKRPNHYNIVKYEPQLQNDYAVSGMCADAISHKHNCVWHVMEGKGTNIDKAIMQIENTINELQDQRIEGYEFNPKLCIIIAKKISNSKKWRKSKKGHFLRNPSIKDQENSKIKIRGIPVKLIYHSEILRNTHIPNDFDKIR